MEYVDKIVFHKTEQTSYIRTLPISAVCTLNLVITYDVATVQNYCLIIDSTMAIFANKTKSQNSLGSMLFR